MNWTDHTAARKWRSDSLEARICAAATEAARQRGAADPDGEGLEAVFAVMAQLYSMPYEAVVASILDQWEIETSPAALHRMWRRFASPWLAERMRRSSAAAREIANQLDPEHIDRATRELISQLTFELISNPRPDPDDVAKLARLLLQFRQADQTDAKIELLRDKARAAAEANDDSTLDEDEKRRRIREILQPVTAS